MQPASNGIRANTTTTHVCFGGRDAELNEANTGLLHAVQARDLVRKSFVEHYAVNQLGVLNGAAG